MQVEGKDPGEGFWGDSGSCMMDQGGREGMAALLNNPGG